MRIAKLGLSAALAATAALVPILAPAPVKAAEPTCVRLSKLYCDAEAPRLSAEWWACVDEQIAFNCVTPVPDFPPQPPPFPWPRPVIEHP